jgi:hypothetical protein
MKPDLSIQSFGAEITLKEEPQAAFVALAVLAGERKRLI